MIPMNKIITFGLAGMLLAAPLYLAAQQGQGQESVADAARRARAERKDSPRSKLTIDEDNLNTITGTVSVVGQQPAAPADQAQNNGAQKPGAPADQTSGKGEAYWRQRFADANKKLNDDAHELDILQREYNLKQQQFYTDPMASLKQEYSRQDLNDSKTKIDEKTAVVAQDKQDISNLEDELRQAGGDPGWENPSGQSGSGSTSAPASAPSQSAPAPSAPPATTAPAAPIGY